MTLALLFPGQGTQHAEMLPWLDDHPAAAPTLQAMATQIGADWRRRLADPAWASDNRVAQTLLTGSCIAAWQCLAPALPAPAAVAGYSVGELPAFCAAGVFDAATALRLAAVRADAMTRAVEGRATGLLAVQGLAHAAVAATCARHGLAIAIRLGDDRAVLGGEDADLHAAQSELTADGVQATRLAVRVASHTPWVAAAAAAFAKHLDGVTFAAPKAALVCNLDGAARRRPQPLKQALAGQIDHPVAWDACLDTLAERGVRCVLEVGPGSTLARSWNRRVPAVPARSIDEFRSPAAIVRWVHALLA